MNENRPTPEIVTRLLGELQARLAKDSFDKEAIRRYGAFVGSIIECHSSLPRAMDRARKLILEAAEENRSLASGTVILADSMSHPRGRFSRQWHAPAGGVWGCMIHCNTLLPESRRFIPMATGVACCEAVHELGVDQATLRWVNDVLVQGKKLAGFLVESYTEQVHGEEFTLVGFGINVNNCLFPAGLSSVSVSLKQILGKDTDLAKFTALFLSRLAWNFGILYHEEARSLKGESFSGKGGQHLLLERWRACSDTVGKRVLYGFDIMATPQYKAEVLRVDDDGGLVLRLEDGHEATEYSGEVRYIE